MQPYYMARLGAETSTGLLDYSENAHLARELRQFSEYLWVDLAHCAMLAECEIVPREDARRIADGLRRIAESDFADRLDTARDGSLLLNIEAELGRLIGADTAALLHTARSRLDQGPTARRMYNRRRMLDILAATVDVTGVIGRVAEEHAGTVMPGYTCLQHANPTTMGHYLTALHDRLLDQADRLIDAYARINLCPLGSAGLSGTSWPVDRDLTANLLAFSSPVQNARCARDAYYAVEIAAHLSTAMSMIYDYASDLHVWSSTEFGIVEIGAAYCGTSSIFPNKRNPTAVDAIRSQAAESVSWLPNLLTRFRGIGTSDVVMQEDELLDDAFSTLERTLALTAEITTSLTVNTRRIAYHLKGSWSTASGLADHLYRAHGVPYRTGYSLVAQLVKRAEESEISRAKVSAGDFNTVAKEAGAEVRLKQGELSAALDPVRFVSGIRSSGGSAPDKLAVLLKQGAMRRARITEFRDRETTRQEAARARCLAWDGGKDTNQAGEEM